MRIKTGIDRRRAARIAAVVVAVGCIALGLAACRGFFGQGPIALLVIANGGDAELPVVVTFDLSGSNDPDGAIVSYRLEFGDGSADEEGVDVSIPVVHEYETAGTFTVVLTVTDADGRIGMTNGTVTVGPLTITFAANRAGDYDIYRMVSDGTFQAVVFNTAEDELFPDLTRRTRDRIAYAAEDGTSWNVWTMNVEGGERTPLTSSATSHQVQPSWSSDASSIVYASNDTQTPSTTTWELFTMTSSGTAQTQLTTQSPSWAIAPAWSPVNDDVVFVSDSDGLGGTADGGSALWLWDASVAAAVMLKDGPGRDGDASPAIAGLGTGLDFPAGAGISRPAWSPDGTLIAYAAEASVGGQIDIYIVQSDGSAVAAGVATLEEYVDHLGVLNTDISTADDEFSPNWLEDGSGITFVKDDGTGDYQIYKVTFATGALTKLTEAGDNLSPASRR
ncbi:MAG: PKD domain-containing protein [Candidatus Bipolaricaulota bacterium]